MPPDARDRIRAAASPISQSPALSRSNTSVSGGRNNNPLPPPPGQGPTRGLSVRRPGAQPPNLPPVNNLAVPGSRTSPTKAPGSSRVTEFYDEFVDSYGGGAEEMPSPPAGASRVSAWARNNANPSAGPGRARSAAPSSYAPSSFGTGVKRRVTRRGTTRGSSRAQSMYEEEEEGYGSGGDILDDDIIRIRVKVCPLRMLTVFSPFS